tara:strand:- start:3341 stop:3778 length:438 start_codon:yes stop_codon:yes gene_type:complete
MSGQNKKHNSRWPTPNHNYVPEYQVSSLPYVTSSHVMSNNEVVNVSFPQVTRWFVVHSTSNDSIRFGFTENGVNGVENNNFYELHSKEMTPRLEMKTKDLYIKSLSNSSTFSIIAGLTSIDSSHFPVLTGSLKDENNNNLLTGVG